MNIHSSSRILNTASIENQQPHLRQAPSKKLTGKLCSIFHAIPFEISKPFVALKNGLILAATSTVQVLHVKRAIFNCFGHISKSKTSETFLPMDPVLTYKRLSNGLTYYVRNDTYPSPKKAYLRLIIRTGFLNETKEERGMAHLIEHISQHKTTHFAKDEIAQYLGSKGLAFGRDRNAYTSTRETGYTLDIPLDDPETLEKALFILSEIGSEATLSNETIEAEREIIVDELGQKNSLSYRYQTKLLSVILEGTPYPDIRDLELEIKNVKECPADIVRNFYKRWYRPENMSVIAVGDFDSKQTASLIEKYFGKIPPSKKPLTPERPYYPTEHKGIRFVCCSSPEADGEAIGIYYKLPIEKEKGCASLNDIKLFLIDKFYKLMLNNRFKETTELDSPPFTSASGFKKILIPEVPYFQVAVSHPSGQTLKAFKQLLIELRKTKEQGFSENEFEQAKQTILSSLDHADLEKDKIPAASFVALYISNFINKTPILDPLVLNEMKKKLLSEITLKDVNTVAANLLEEENCVVGTLSPEKSGLSSVTEDDLKKVMEDVSKEVLLPRIETTVDVPLLSKVPTPGVIVSTKFYEKSDVTEYTLENGLKVYVKPTCFKNNSISIFGYSLRGSRDASLKERFSATFGDDFFDKCGLGDLDLSSLRKTLSKKQVAFSAKINNYLTSLAIVSVKKDLETAFQMFYLMFTNPGYRKASFEKALKELENDLLNRNNNSLIILADEILATNTQKHPEFMPIRSEDLDQITYETTKSFHQQSFSNPGQFAVVIVGNIDQKGVTHLIQNYMASIPKGMKETRTNFNYSPVPFPKGIIRKEIYAGERPSSLTYLTFPAPISDTRQARMLSTWSCDFLQTRLMEVLRNQMGKTYTLFCSFINTPIPHVNPDTPSKVLIKITCDASNLKEIEEAIMKEIRHLQEVGPSEQEINDFKISQFNKQRESLNTNEGWLTSIAATLLWNKDKNIDQFDECDKYLEDLNVETMRDHFNYIFPLDNFTLITLHPKPTQRLESA